MMTNEQRSYLVQWEIDVDASSPLEAAKEAWEAMRAEGSIANVFNVCDSAGNSEQVDLQEHFEGDSDNPSDL